LVLLPSLRILYPPPVLLQYLRIPELLLLAQYHFIRFILPIIWLIMSNSCYC
jgi:hypothetical protein